MEQSPFWEANSHSVNQEIPSLLRNPKARYRAHKSPSVPKPYVTSPEEAFLYGEELLAPRPTFHAVGSPLPGCPRLLIEYSYCCRPYLGTGCVDTILEIHWAVLYE